MGILTLLFCVIPTIVTAITVSSNGNSPEIKMLGGMMVDVQKGFAPMVKHETTTSATTTKSNYEKSRTLDNSTKLSINERYRRLIPYMTFYYANDISTTEAYSGKNVEVEKVEIVEAKTIQSNHRQPHKILYAPQRNIPRYQGNRLTHFNIASANPTKVYYKNDVPHYQTANKNTPNYNPIIPEVSQNYDQEYVRYIQKPNIQIPNVSFTTTRKPYFNHYNGDTGTVQYYFAEKEHVPKYKLVPYEQTPVKIVPQTEIYETKKPIGVPVLVQKEPVYIKPKPARPQYIYDDIHQLAPRKPPVVVSESYYEKRRPASKLVQPISQPIVESGFKPIVSPAYTTEPTIYSTSLPTPNPQFVSEKPNIPVVAPIPPESNTRPNYYQYVIDQPLYKPEQYVEPAPAKTTVSLGDLLNSLQLNKSIPKPITKENVSSSISTLLQVLTALRALSNQNDVEAPLLSTPKPFIVSEAPVVAMSPKSVIEVTAAPVIPSPIPDADLQNDPHLAQVNVPSQHLDESFPSGGGSTSQQFPLPVTSDDEGGTPGRPGVDYPILTSIPNTSFNCKTQRYKGFFADTETRCQVWHYCDLNGGQASFLCPNGTIFSQAGLTCDWWFNVRCASTTQLYVLNESLYKYILPHSPKFPEDYSGPLVDKYLTLKFKEMEEQFRKNKKQKATEKIDTDEKESNEDSSEKEQVAEKDSENSDVTTVSEASVVVQSPGTSGNVHRLQDE